MVVRRFLSTFTFIVLGCSLSLNASAQITIFGLNSSMSNREIVSGMHSRGLQCEGEDPVYVPLGEKRRIDWSRITCSKVYSKFDTTTYVKVNDDYITIFCHAFNGCSEDFSIRDVGLALEKADKGGPYVQSGNKYCYKKMTRPKEEICIQRRTDTFSFVNNMKYNYITIRRFSEANEFKF